MKKVGKATWWLWCWLTLAPVLGLAQPLSGEKTRELFINKEADGMEVVVWCRCADKPGQLIVVDPGRNFYEGDELRLEFKSNFDGVVYLLNVEPSGRTRIIYPRPARTARDLVRLRAGEVIKLPANPEDVIQFDGDVGIEVIKIMLARQPIAEFEAALQAGDPNADAVELARARPASASEDVGIVPPRTDQGCGAGIELTVGGEPGKCRGVAIGKSNAAKSEGVVFVVAATEKLKGILSNKDIVAIDLRLKHIKRAR